MLGQTSKRILVVDDEEEIVNCLSTLLKRAGYEVISTTEGVKSLELAEKFKPDVILLDILIPDMEGSEIASKLSEKPATASIPIIFLTALISKKEELSVKKTGNHYVVAKPTTEKELLGMISRALLKE